MMPMKNVDQLQRFIFDNTAVRGNIAHLEQTVQQALQHQHYPAVLRNALAELMVASMLLAATLKMQGKLILQIQSNGPLQLLVVECSSNLEIRATAKWQGEIATKSFLDLLQQGQFVITLTPENNGENYQGIVPIEGDSIADILQNYMQRSEQIETRIWLNTNGNKASGLLLQKLPEQLETDSDAWNRICHLAETIQPNELLYLESQTLLYRLFHEEQTRIFTPQLAQFKCRCSRKHVGNMLRMLGNEEIQSILMERSNIEVHCDFCNKAYHFDAVDVAHLHTSDTLISAPTQRH